MQDDRWQQVVELAKKNFTNVSVTTEDLIVPTPDGPNKQGTQDILEFTKGSETYKLVRENRPMVLEKKEHYSHRAGDTARTEYKFSDTEFSHKVRVFKENDLGDFEEITLDNLGL